MHRLKRKKIQDPAGMLTLKCWPESVSLANNYIFLLLVLYTEQPDLTSTWQINM